MSQEKKNDFPEHTKLRKLPEYHRAVVEFVSWIRSSNVPYDIVGLGGRETPTMDELVFGFLNIDPEKFEGEKDRIQTMVKNLVKRMEPGEVRVVEVG